MEKSPFELSLDEIIALNKIRNKEPEEEEEEMICESTDLETSSATFDQNVSSQNENINVDQRLRMIPGFGSRPIHHRLGYLNNMRKLQKPTVFKNTRTMNLLKRAKSYIQQRNKNPLNPVVRIKNPDAIKAHSVKASLNSKTQREIRAIMREYVPGSLDLEMLKNFQFEPNVLSMTTNERFSRLN